MALAKLSTLAVRAVAQLAKLSSVTGSRRLYVGLVRLSHQINGVRFTGQPRYIHSSAILDPSGGLVIGDRVVISMDVLVLTHDYAITAGLRAAGRPPRTDIAVRAPVRIGDNCFIGARAIILGGTVLGDNVIVGAGAVVKGTVPDDSVVCGVPGVVIAKASEWAVRKLAETPGELLYRDPT